MTLQFKSHNMIHQSLKKVISCVTLVHLAYPASLQSQIIWNKQFNYSINKNPNWQEGTFWLFTSVAEDLNSGQPWANPASYQIGTLTPDPQIASRTRWSLGHAAFCKVLVTNHWLCLIIRLVQDHVERHHLFILFPNWLVINWRWWLWTVPWIPRNYLAALNRLGNW